METDPKDKKTSRTAVFDQILQDYNIAETGEGTYQVERDGVVHEGSFKHIIEIAKKEDLAGGGNPGGSE